MPTPLRILLCDDHAQVRAGLRHLLNLELDLEVVGEAGDADAALVVAGQTNPDLVIMDVRMPGRSGIEACRELCAAHPGMRVLMLTSCLDDHTRRQAMLAGASGCVVKQLSGNDLLDGIRRAAA